MHKVKFRKLILFAPLLVVFFFAYAFREVPEKVVPAHEKAFKAFLTIRTQALLSMLNEMDNLVGAKHGKKDHERLKELFNLSRAKYKEIETFIIHFFPGDAFALNVPDLVYPEEDDEVSIIREPHGFQVLERLIYLDSSRTATNNRKEQLRGILDIVEKWPTFFVNVDFPEREIFEAAQQGLIRNFLVGLTNIETPWCRNAFQESISYVSALKEVFSEMYVGDTIWTESLQQEFLPIFDRLNDILIREEKKEHPDFFTIYSEYYIPASEVLGKLRHFIVKNNFFHTTAVNLQVRSIFDPGAYNTYFFLPGKTIASQKDVVHLGKLLFFDPSLSANNERSCASCHKPALAFTDGLTVSRSFDKSTMLARNAPGLLNAVLQRKLFHDGRSFSFENQASEVMNNPDEMHADFSKVAGKLSGSAEYKELFRNAFRNTDDTIISSRSILMAIAEYERSLTALNSRFDKTIRGQEDLLSPEEKLGFNISVGKGNCASCHFMPLFNGTVPPEYVESEMEVLGVPGNSDLDNPIKDLDPGREAIIPMEIYNGSFKTPTLRNVELTAPYMHNGVFRTLEEVVEFYDRGGGLGIGLDVPHQTLIPDSLKLTAKEKELLVKFMKSLTDTVNTTDVPTKLPLFDNMPELNGRNPGGVY